MSAVPVITIDGPSGSGKGAISQRVAERLGYHLLDSGALYRILGCVALKDNLDLNDHGLLARTANNLDIKFGLSGAGSVSVNGQDFSALIRRELAGDMASRVGAIQEVRNALMRRQMDFRKPPGLVADGRDMGTVVFPDATLKIFLTATPLERASRRYKQLIAKGIGAILPDLLQELNERDERDSNRSVSPLRPATDAHIIDTTELSIDEVVNRVMDLVEGSSP